MNISRPSTVRAALMISLTLVGSIAASRLHADTGTCGGQTITLPFTDVPSTNIFFCQIAGAFFSGLTNGTSATTYSPAANVPRDQMAAFLTRTMDQSLRRGSRKAVTGKWWTPQDAKSLTLTDLFSPRQVKFDGTDLWVASRAGSRVTRVRPSDGKVLETWTGATNAYAIVAAMGKIFITGQTTSGNLYVIDPTQPAGAVTTLSSSLADIPVGIAFDGSRIWTANLSSVSIVTLNPTLVNTVSHGFISVAGILFDGDNIWVTDGAVGALHKLNSDGSIAQSIAVGTRPESPVFDGTNIWVPDSSSDALFVVRVKDAVGNPLASAFVLATPTGNGLNFPRTASFDGERILVTNFSGNSVSMWKAADLTPLGSFSTGAGSTPYGACSDGLNFWITLVATNKLARF